MSLLPRNFTKRFTSSPFISPSVTWIKAQILTLLSQEEVDLLHFSFTTFLLCVSFSQSSPKSPSQSEPESPSCYASGPVREQLSPRGPDSSRSLHPQHYHQQPHPHHHQGHASQQRDATRPPQTYTQPPPHTAPGATEAAAETASDAAPPTAEATGGATVSSAAAVRPGGETERKGTLYDLVLSSLYFRL